jgi:hypothetical protein
MAIRILTEDDKSELEHKIEETVENIPSGLPEVTADNNGAFLRVVDGTWAVATIPSAEGVGF